MNKNHRLLSPLIAFLLIFPILFVIILSLGKTWYYPALLPEHWSVAAWGSLFQDQRISQGIVLSLIISISVGATASFLSLLLARSIAYSAHQRQWLVGAYLPYLVSPVVLAAAWQYYFLRLGMAGQVQGVWLAQFLITLPFGVIFFNSFWNIHIRSLEQLAATLGGSPWQSFWLVSFPLARGPLLICFFQSFLISWFEYGLTALIGVGKVQTLPLLVFQYVGEANVFYAALASCLLMGPPLLLLWINKRFVFIRSGVIADQKK
jgi:putative spermidine/putrescine transport system permease protein